MASGRVLARGRRVRGRIRVGVVVCGCLVRMWSVARVMFCRLAAVMVVRRNHSRLIRPLTFRAQHGSRHRAPDGEQQGQQDQDEDTESFHVGGLSDR